MSEVPSLLGEVPNEQVNFLSVECYQVVDNILKDLKIVANVDMDVIHEATAMFLRDIFRIDERQKGKVSLAKYAGYWGYWLKTLKPINNAKVNGSDKLRKDDLRYINELVAIYFALHIFVDFQNESEVRSECDEGCIPGSTKGTYSSDFKNYVAKYLNYNDRFFLSYITYSMRNRAYGPHNLTLLIETLNYTSQHATVDQ